MPQADRHQHKTSACDQELEHELNRVAPSALRTPISRVRSSPIRADVHDADAATSRLTAAMSANR